MSTDRLRELIASKEFEIRCDHGGDDERAGINDVRREIIKYLTDYASLLEELAASKEALECGARAIMRYDINSRPTSFGERCADKLRSLAERANAGGTK